MQSLAFLVITDEWNINLQKRTRLNLAPLVDMQSASVCPSVCLVLMMHMAQHL